MNEKTDARTDRRGFVRGLFRWMALGGLVGGAAALARRGADGKLLCINDANCRTCSRCCNCELSQYESPGCGPECSSKS